MSTISRPTNQDELRTYAVPVEDEVSDAGTVEAGASTIGFLNTSTTEDATVNGRTLAPGVSKTYPFVGRQYGSITYDASAGSLEICAVF